MPKTKKSPARASKAAPKKMKASEPCCEPHITQTMYGASALLIIALLSFLLIFMSTQLIK